MRNFQNLDFVDYLRIIRRRIWYLIVPAMLISAGTFIYVSRLPDLYKSTTTITVAARLLPDDYIGSIVRETGEDRIEFVKQQLGSRTFLERIAQEFAPPGANIDDFVSWLNGSKEVTAGPSAMTIGFTSTEPDLAQRITQRLAERVMQLNDTFRKQRIQVADQFLEEQVRQAANEVAQSEEKLRQFYQKHFPDMPQDQSASLQMLNDLGRERAALENAIESIVTERKLLEQRRDEQRKFKAAMASRPAPPPPPPQVQIRQPSKTEQLLAAKRDQLADERLRHTDEWPDIKTIKREIKELEGRVALEKTEPVTPPEPVVAASTQEVTDDSLLPKSLDFSLDFSDVETQVRLEALDKDLRNKQAAKDLLVQKIVQYQRRVNAPPDILEQLAGLQRDRQIANQRYELLSGKKFSSDLAGRVDTDVNNQTFRIIDPPNLSVRPFGPNRSRMIALGCLASIAFGFGLIFAREYLDLTLSDGDAAAAALKLPVLAMLPSVRAARKKRAAKARSKGVLNLVVPEEDGKFSLVSADGRIRSVVLDPSTISGEQCRVARAQLSALRKQRTLSTILVTSAIPYEGKTFAACCLAGILAQEPGKKVLLIDADLRTESVSKRLGIRRRVGATGLSDVLRGAATVEESLVHCADLHWSVLLPGTIVDNPTEILSSPEFERLMKEVVQVFDWIIVDSPPALALADADLLLRHCDAALLVINADTTPLKLIKDSLERIGRHRVCGVLVNRVRALSSSHYYRRYYRQLSVSKS